jgi:hypothetical protein
LRRSFYNFKTYETFSKACIIKMTEKQWNYFNQPWNFHAKRQGGGGWRFFK